MSQLLLALTVLCPAVAGCQAHARGAEHPGADSLHRQAIKHYRLANMDSSLIYFGRALKVQRVTGDRAGEATTLSNIGLVQDRLGRLDSALAYYALALSINREGGSRSGEATTLNNIGAALDDLGRPDSALAYFLKALPIQREIRDRPGEARTLNNIGVLQRNLGRPDSALFYYAGAASIQRELPDRRDEAITLGNVGAVHASQGQLDSAVSYHARALAIQREFADRLGEATTLYRLGWAQHKLGRPDSALAFYSLALLIQREVGERLSEARTLDEIGVVHRSQGRPDSALAYHSRSLLLRRAVGDIAGEVTTLTNMGLGLLDVTGRGGALSAASTFDSAAALLTRIRLRAGSDANAVSLADDRTDIFSEWSRAWGRLARESAAAGDNAALTRAVSSSLAAAERGRAQALRDLLDRGARPSAAAAEAADTIAGADLGAEASRLLAPLRQSHAAFLYYLADGDTLRTWFLDTSGALTILPPIVRLNGELIDRIGAARVRMGADDAAARRRRGEIPSDSRNDLLGSDLVADLDPNASDAALHALSESVLPSGLDTLLAPGAELVIVPHGALGQVPFAALALAGDSLPLGLRNAIRYAPSLRSLLGNQATNGSDTLAGKEIVGWRALVVGNPEMPRVLAKDGTTRQLSPLVGAASEGAWVATRLGAPLLTGTAATEQVVRDRMPGASIIHLATHGLAYGTEARVRDSYVALTPGAGHDGFFTLGELLDDDSIQLSADLIVLSACQTGLGETRQAEGTVGLQRGLLAKGARSVLVSLWSVDDAATKLLMERFYTHWLGAGNSPVVGKAEALRRAQADVRAVPSFYNPRYWAAFQLVGAH